MPPKKNTTVVAKKSSPAKTVAPAKGKSPAKAPATKGGKATVASRVQAKVAGPKTTKAKKVTKQYRDNIKGITNPALKRLLRRAAVKRISAPVYEALRNIIVERLREVVTISTVYMEEQKSHTLSPEFVRESLKQLGQTIAIGGLRSDASQSVFKRHAGQPKKRVTEGEAGEAPKAKRSVRAGVVAARDIKREQKQSDRFALQRLPFQRLVREQFQEAGQAGIRVNALAFDILQLYIETVVVALCAKTVLLATHAGRGTVQVQDIDLAQILARM